MAKEEEAGIRFTDIHINLADQTITLKKEDDVVATLVFEGKLPAAGVIFLGSHPQALLDSPFDEEPEIPVSPTSSVSAADAAKERKKPLPFPENSRVNRSLANRIGAENQLPMPILRRMWKEKKAPMTMWQPFIGTQEGSR